MHKLNPNPNITTLYLPQFYIIMDWTLGLKNYNLKMAHNFWKPVTTKKTGKKKCTVLVFSVFI